MLPRHSSWKFSDSFSRNNITRFQRLLMWNSQQKRVPRHIRHSQQQIWLDPWWFHHLSPGSLETPPRCSWATGSKTAGSNPALLSWQPSPLTAAQLKDGRSFEKWGYIYTMLYYVILPNTWGLHGVSRNRDIAGMVENGKSDYCN